MRIEVLYSVTRIGETIAIHADRFQGEHLLTSKQVAQLTITEADSLVRELSHAIHEGGDR
jgi:hypothetical protein